jgi:hypothetical protein
MNQVPHLKLRKDKQEKAKEPYLRRYVHVTSHRLFSQVEIAFLSMTINNSPHPRVPIYKLHAGYYRDPLSIHIVNCKYDARM